MPLPASVVYIYWFRSVKVFGGKMNPADVFAGSGSLMATARLIVRELTAEHVRISLSRTVTKRQPGLCA